jgi:N,N'-diacetyllegionaminate synthase
VELAIGLGEIMKTFVVSEIGINHNGDLDEAKQMVLESKKCGCSAVKLQTYQTDKRVASDSPIYDILKRCELSYEQQKDIKEYADSIGIEFFSTPFDVDSLLFLVDELGVRRIKLASFDVTNLKFLDAVNDVVKRCQCNIIMSTGMANVQEIDEAVLHLKEADYANLLTILHCVSSYPLCQSDANLSAIGTLKKLYPRHTIGYSDHTDGCLVPALSVLAGAEVVEKHFTIDKDGPGVDNPVSIDTCGMKNMIEQIQLFEQILGTNEINMSDAESAAEQFRRHS